MAVKSSFKNMTLCLLAICLVCSSLLAGVYALTKEPILKAANEKNEKAIKEVLPESAVVIGEEETVEYEGQSYAYNLAFDADSTEVGCAINVSAAGGFGGPILMKVGFDSDGVIWNVKVLSHSETPGLGAKCVEPDFTEQFQGFNPAAGKLLLKKDHFEGEINAITASTITSRAYTSGVALAAQVYYTIHPDKDASAQIDAATGASTDDWQKAESSESKE